MENKPKFKPDPNLRLMDQVKQVLRYHHYSYRTEQTYTDWILRFIRFHGSRKHPLEMGKSEVEAFFKPSRDQSQGGRFNPEAGA